MLKERIATAMVLLGLFLSALFVLPTRQFAVLVGSVVAVGAFEWATLVKAAGSVRFVFSALCTGLFVLVVWGGLATNPWRPEVAVCYVLIAIFWIFRVPVWLARGTGFGSLGVALFVGVLVVVPGGISIVSLHSVSPAVLLTFIAFVWIADTGAYFAGRRFGRHKLAPAISPGKTWEGVTGALAAALIYASICALAWPQLGKLIQGWVWLPYLAVSILLCAVSIVGDLFESSVKRQAKVKDSGTLLPGHGGVLDRIDSITSTIPVAALLLYLTGEGL